MKFATKALIGLGILAVGALYLKAKFDAAVDAYPDDFEFDKSLDDKDDTHDNPFNVKDALVKNVDFSIPLTEPETDEVAEKHDDKNIEINKNKNKP